MKRYTVSGGPARFGIVAPHHLNRFSGYRGGVRR